MAEGHSWRILWREITLLSSQLSSPAKKFCWNLNNIFNNTIEVLQPSRKILWNNCNARKKRKNPQNIFLRICGVNYTCREGNSIKMWFYLLCLLFFKRTLRIFFPFGVHPVQRGLGNRGHKSFFIKKMAEVYYECQSHLGTLCIFSFKITREIYI